MKAIGVICTTIFVLLYSVLMNGWALATLWKWFVVPTLGAPLLSIPAAIGASIIVTYLTHQDVESTDTDDSWEKSMLNKFLVGTFKPLFALLFGFIVTKFL